MTDDAIRIAIAQVAGFEARLVHAKYWQVFNPAGICISHVCGSIESAWLSALACKSIPRYPGDLNAMHETEKTLTSDQVDSYKAHLIDIIFAEAESRKGIWHATASQRAEAFLRVKGKWEP